MKKRFVAVLIIGLFLWSEAGSNSTGSKLAPRPAYQERILSDSVYNGRVYQVVETTRVTVHLRSY